MGDAEVSVGRVYVINHLNRLAGYYQTQPYIIITPHSYAPTYTFINLVLCFGLLM